MVVFPGVSKNAVPKIMMRAARVCTVTLLFAMCISCGQTYRPVAIPVTPPPPDPSGFHFALALNSNGPNNVGTTTRIDVSGDTNVGVTKVGLGSVHATLLPGGGRLYTANSLVDTVSSYIPTSPTALFTVTLPTGSEPVFVHSTENGTVYAANYKAGTVAAVSVAANVVTNIIPVGANPVALAETPDAAKLYAVNQGSSSVSSINVQDKSVNAPITNGINSPVWAIARNDSQRVYVLNGDGSLADIDTSDDSVVPVANVAGPGANFMYYDKHFNRLYITNPTAASLSIVDIAADPPQSLGTIALTSGSNGCPAGCTPVSVAVLPDGSRAYVASYVCAAGCPAGSTLTAYVSAINAQSQTITKLIAYSPVTTDPTNPTACQTTLPDGFPLARFRVSVATSGDSSKVYMSNCDGGYTGIIRTSDDTQVLDLQNNPLVIQAPVSAFPPPTPGAQPPPQNPVLMMPGQ
jgi:hypothetical protein